MKPYGLKRLINYPYPDCADIYVGGRKSSAGNIPGKGGDIRSSFKSSSSKRSTRRYWKRVARAQHRKECVNMSTESI